MPRPVVTKHSLLVHLYPDDGSKTICGVTPFGKAPLIIKRIHMCCNCFGKDRGVKYWNAVRLGLNKIEEIA